MNWRCFPLEEVNRDEEGVPFWEMAPEEAKSLRAFQAAESARDQGTEVFRAFVDCLLDAVHRDRLRVHEPETIENAARATPGLDADRLLADMSRPELRQRIEADYREAVDSYGVFGTPTLLLEGGEPVFLKMNSGEMDSALEVWSAVRSLSTTLPNVRELKKPRKPDPK